MIIEQQDKEYAESLNIDQRKVHIIILFISFIVQTGQKAHTIDPIKRKVDCRSFTCDGSKCNEILYQTTWLYEDWLLSTLNIIYTGELIRILWVNKFLSDL